MLTGLDIAGLVDHHRATASDVTLYLTPVEDPRAYGLVPTDQHGRVTAFLEKPKTEAEIVTKNINAGCYVFKRSVIDAIPAGRPVSVERETFPGLLAGGRARDRRRRQRVLARPRHAAVVRAGLVRPGARCGALAGGAGVRGLPGPGRRAASPADAQVHGGTVIGRDAVVDAGAIVNGAVVFDDAQIAEGAHVSNSIVGVGAVIGAGTVLHGAVIGDGAVIGRGNELLQGVRIWPDVEVADGSIRFSAEP